MFPEFRSLSSQTKNHIDFDLYIDDNLCQFLLDPTSFNLSTRVSLQDPLVPDFFQLSRDFCYVLDKTRIGMLTELDNKHQK